MKEFKKYYDIYDIWKGEVHVKDSIYSKLYIITITNKDQTKKVEYQFILREDNNIWELNYIDYDFGRDKMPTVGPF